MEQFQTHEATRDNAVAQVDAEKCVRDSVGQGSGKSPRDLHGWKVSGREWLATCHLPCAVGTILHGDALYNIPVRTRQYHRKPKSLHPLNSPSH
jgi:hypothetical protein